VCRKRWVHARTCVYASDPAVVAHVTATTVVPTMFRATIPSLAHAGMNTKA